MSQSTLKTTGLTGPARQLDDFLQRQMSKTSAQVKLVDLFTAIMTLLAGLLAGLFLVAVIDAWIIELRPWMRWTALATMLLGSAAFALLVILPLMIRKINPVYAAKVIETARPDIKNGLINYLLLRSHERDDRMVSRRVIELVGSRAANDISGIEVAGLVDKSSTIRIALALVTIVTVLGLYKVFSPKDPFQTFARIMAPLSDVARPARVRISDVKPGNATVYFGQPMPVSARISGQFNNESVKLVYSTTDGQVIDEQISMQPSESDAGTFVALLKTDERGIGHSLKYHVKAGDGKSAEYTMVLKSTPMLSVEKITYQPPAYTHWPEQTATGTSEISALEGTLVSIDAVSNTHLQSAALELLRQRSDSGFDVVNTVSMSNEEPMRARCQFRLQLDSKRQAARYSHYRLTLITAEGKPGESAAPCPVRVIPDLAPEIQILDPLDTELSVPLNSRIRFVIRAQDADFELSTISVAGDSFGAQVFSEVIPLPRDADLSGQINTRFDLWPKKLRMRAGETVLVAFTAADNRCNPLNDVLDPNRTTSVNYVINVTDPVENPPADDSSQASQASDDKQSSAGDDRQDDPNSKGNQVDDTAQKEGAEGGSRPDGENPSDSDKSGDEKQQGENGNSDRQGNSSGQKDESRPGDSNESEAEGQSRSSGTDQSAAGDDQSGDADSGSGGDSSSAASGDADSKQGEATDSGAEAGSSPSGGNSADAGQENASAADRQNPNSSATGANGGDTGSPLGKDAHPGDIIEEINRIREQQEKNHANSGQPNSAQPDSGQSDSGQSGSGESGSDSNPSANDGSGDSSRTEGDDASTSGNPGQQASDSSDPAGKQGESGSGEPKTDSADQADAGQKNSQSGNPTTRQPGQGQNPSNAGSPSSSPDSGTAGSNEQSPSSGGNREESKDETSGSGEGGSDSGADKAGTEKPQPSREAGGGGADQQQPSAGSSGSQDPSGKPSGSDPAQPGGDSHGNGGESGTGQPGDAGQNQTAQPGDSASQSSPSASGDSKSAQSQSGAGDSSGNSSASAGDSEGDPSAAPDQAPDSGQASQSGSSSGQPPGDRSSTESGNPNPAPGSGHPGDFGGGSPGAGNQPGSGGSAGNPGGATPDNPPPGEAESTQDAANLDYTRKATDLALDYLSGQEANPDPELLERLNWTESDLRDFVKRWKDLKQRAASGGSEDKKEWEQTLRSLGLAPKPVEVQQTQLQADKQAGYQEEGRVSNAPAGFRAFQKRRNRVDQERSPR